MYPIALDSGNLLALDLRIVKWKVATPSHARPLESRYSQAALHRRANCMPRRDKIRVRTSILGKFGPCDCANPNFASSVPACVRADRRGRATSTREQESPLPIYDSEIKGR
ncbi:hypothetical protein CRG98_029785 [Punica granatum]|uniref:Uncharacterized protein n=1 Tax=Punica granatum TaxID=22663 RepID=A0A2I0J0N5_PUNGR|nr:hypothetical protein CRG98_029785 [Punica granatum]